MGKVKDKNLAEILKRSTAEKLFVVESLWENIRNEVVNENANNVNKEELDFANERYEDYKKNPSQVKKWDDIKKDYFKKKK